MPKKTAKDLTVAMVAAAKAKDRPYELRDAKVRGLLLRVQPSGIKSWVVIYSVGGRKTRKTIGSIGDPQTETLAYAREEAKKVLEAAEVGIDVNEQERRARATTLGSYLKTYYTPYAEAHIKSHANILKRLKTNFGDLFSKPIGEISEMDIERWRKKKAEAKKPVTFETLQRELTYLKAALNLAVKEFKLVPRHQLERYQLKRRTNTPERSNAPTIRYLTPDEEKRLRGALDTRESRMRRERASANAWRQERRRELLPALDSAYTDYLKPMVLIALNTGLRRGDLFDLDWSHIDLVQRQIRKVINKTSRKSNHLATLPLSDEAVAILTTWKEQSAGHGLIFASPRSGGRLDNIAKAWRGLVEDAEIEDFRFHDLRHTFASRLVMGGIDLNTVRELMTHADIKMTLVYAHLSPDHKAEAISRVFADIPGTATPEVS